MSFAIGAASRPLREPFQDTSPEVALLPNVPDARRAERRGSSDRAGWPVIIPSAAALARRGHNIAGLSRSLRRRLAPALAPYLPPPAIPWNAAVAPKQAHGRIVRGTRRAS